MSSEGSGPVAGPSNPPRITTTRAIRLSSFSFSKDFAHPIRPFGSNRCTSGSNNNSYRRPITIHQSDPVSRRTADGGGQLATVPESSTSSLLRSRKWFLSGENLSSTKDDQEVEVRRSSAVVVPTTRYAEWSSGEEEEGDGTECSRRRHSLRRVSHWQRNAPSLQQDHGCITQRQTSKPAILVTITSASRVDSSSSLISLTSISSSSSGSSGMGSTGDQSARSSNPLSSSSCSSAEDRKESEEEGIYSPPPPSNTPTPLLSLELAAENFGDQARQVDKRRRIPPLSEGCRVLPPTTIPQPPPAPPPSLFPWGMTPALLPADIAVSPHPLLPAAQHLAGHVFHQQKHLYQQLFEQQLLASAIPRHPELMVPGIIGGELHFPPSLQLPPPSLLGEYTPPLLAPIHYAPQRPPWLLHPLDPFDNQSQRAANVIGFPSGVAVKHQFSTPYVGKVAAILGPGAYGSEPGAISNSLHSGNWPNLQQQRSASQPSPTFNIAPGPHHLRIIDTAAQHSPATMGSESRPKKEQARAGPSGLNRNPNQDQAHSDAIVWMNKQMFDFTHGIEQSRDTLKKKLKVRDLIFDHLRLAFEKCGLFVVGSSLNGFGTNNSDMDLCLMITGRDIDQRSDAVQALSTAQRVLANVDFVAKQLLIQAKVPILRIRLKEPFAGITVDLNVNNSVAIRNTHLLFYYSIFDEFGRVKPLVAVVKEWARRKGINDASTSSLTSYSLVLMVIHYLQCGTYPYPAILPSLQRLCPYRFDGTRDVRRLDISHRFDDPSVDHFRSFSRNQLSVAQLLMGFLAYYAHHFDFHEDVISVRLGCKINRREVAENHAPYNQHNQWQWQWICIEEPFTLSNTAHAVYDKRVFEEIKNAFITGYDDLLASKGDLNAWLNGLKSIHAPR